MLERTYLYYIKSRLEHSYPYYQSITGTIEPPVQVAAMPCTVPIHVSVFDYGYLYQMRCHYHV
jgi:hypothetical protein